MAGIDRQNWTLLVLAAARGGSLPPVKLQKALFLISRDVPADERRKFYKFRPYDYGPFSRAIYSDAEELEALGLVEIEPSEFARYRLYRATPKGIEFAIEQRSMLRPATVAYLDRMLEWVQSLSFKDLVRAIYKAYPEMRVNSVFRG